MTIQDWVDYWFGKDTFKESTEFKPSSKEETIKQFIKVIEDE